MLVREVVVHQLLLNLAGLSVRCVVESDAAFFLNSVALIVEVLLSNCETAHSIRFQVQRQLELIRRQCFEIVRPIFVGRAIHCATVVVDEHEVFRLADIL